MSVSIRLASAFQSYTQGTEVLYSAPGTIKDIILALDKLYSGIADALLQNSELKNYVLVFVNDKPAGIDTMVVDDDEVAILPLVVGG